MEISQMRLAAVLIIVVAIILGVLFVIALPDNPIQGQTNSKNSSSNGNPSGMMTPPAGASGPAQTPFKIGVGGSNTSSGVSTIPNCTHTALYWVHHLEAWPDHIFVGTLSYTKEEALAIIQATSVDISNLLFIQFTGAYLNIVHGADPKVIESVMIEASDWLLKHPSGEILFKAEVQQPLGLVETLESYNQGGMGPVLCPDEPSSYEGQAASIPVPILSMTPASIILTNVATNTPTITFTPTSTPTRTPPPIPPTATFTATPKPPPKPVPPKATQPPPAPTKEPPQPTKEPPPPPPPPPPTDKPPPPTEPPPEPPPEPTQAG